MCDCGCAALHPQPMFLLLANHHTTQLYLGHSNVLLLSPLADALCCNLQKIGWEEEKSVESGRRDEVVTEAKSFLPCKNWTSSFMISFQNSLLSLLFSFHLSLHPSSPHWGVIGFYILCSHRSFPSPSVHHSLLFMSWFTLCSNHQWNLLKNPYTFNGSQNHWPFKGNPWSIDFFFPTAQKSCWYLIDGPWGEKMRERDVERKKE